MVETNSQEIGPVDVLRFLWKSKHYCLGLMLVFPLIGFLFFSDAMSLHGFSGAVYLSPQNDAEFTEISYFDELSENITFLTTKSLPFTITEDLSDSVSSLNVQSVRPDRDTIMLTFESTRGLPTKGDRDFSRKLVEDINKRITIHNNYVANIGQKELPFVASRVKSDMSLKAAVLKNYKKYLGRISKDIPTNIDESTQTEFNLFDFINYEILNDFELGKISEEQYQKHISELANYRIRIEVSQVLSKQQLEAANEKLRFLKTFDPISLSDDSRTFISRSGAIRKSILFYGFLIVFGFVAGLTISAIVQFLKVNSSEISKALK